MEQLLYDFRLHASNFTSKIYVPTIIGAVNDLQPSTLVYVALVLLTLYSWPVWTRHRYPPGPWPLPFVGHLPWFGFSQNPNEWVTGLREKYGDVITFDMNMNHKVVFLTGAEAIYDGFVKQADSLSNRPPISDSLMPLIKGKGIINEDDGRWQPLRRFGLNIFREHGIGKKGIEPVITEELSHFLSALQNTDRNPFDPLDLLAQGVSNLISYVVFGDRIDYSDEKIQNIQFGAYASACAKTKFMPLLRYIPGDPTGYQKGKRSAEKGFQFAEDQVKKHMDEIDYHNPPRDFIDAYILKMKEEESNPETPFTADNFKAMVMQLYFAGTDTTSSQLYWAYRIMGVYTDIQERVHQEITQVLGERAVSYADRNAMPYTTAVLTEIQRFRGVAYVTRRYASADVTVQGYNIPKGTMVGANLWSLLHDKRIYPEPEKFDPERFLSRDGKFIKPDPKHAIFFGAGRRACIGEHLARAEIFMFFVSTLQKFQIELPKGQNVSLKAHFGFLCTPEKRYTMTCTPRS